MADVVRLTAQAVEAVATKFTQASDSTEQPLSELGATVEGMSAGSVNKESEGSRPGEQALIYMVAGDRF